MLDECGKVQDNNNNNNSILGWACQESSEINIELSHQQPSKLLESTRRIQTATQVFTKGSRKRPADGIIYIGVGSSGASRPSKARRPVLNLGTFSSGLFFASCVLEGYECQSPGDSSELPEYLDTSLLPEKKKLSTRLVRTSIFFPTPLDNVVPLASLNHRN